MDPVTATSLVATCIGVADVAARLCGALRRLQQEYSGALAHAEEIAQQASRIHYAIHEICEALDKSPNLFPPSFETVLRDSTTSINSVIGHIQGHAKSVKAKAERSPSVGKMTHLWRAEEVLQWKNSLGDQIQAIILLLQVSGLYVFSCLADVEFAINHRADDQPMRRHRC